MWHLVCIEYFSELTAIMTNAAIDRFLTHTYMGCPMSNILLLGAQIIIATKEPLLS